MKGCSDGGGAGKRHQDSEEKERVDRTSYRREQAETKKDRN